MLTYKIWGSHSSLIEVQVFCSVTKSCGRFLSILGTTHPKNAVFESAKERYFFLSNAPPHPIYLKWRCFVLKFFMLHQLTLLIIVVLEWNWVWSLVELTYRKKRSTGSKTCPSTTLSAPSLSHRLDWDWTSTVTDQWSNTWALPCPFEALDSSEQFMKIYLPPHRKHSATKLKTPAGFVLFRQTAVLLLWHHTKHTHTFCGTMQKFHMLKKMVCIPSTVL